MDRPRVSVLLPVRDAAATLPECLRSLAAQTLFAHEVVAVDDGSGDASGTLLEQAARADPRLRVVHIGPRGLVRALNTALELSHAPLVARMDADDVAHPERLLAQARRLEGEPRLDVLGCRVAPLGGASGMRAYLEWQNALLDHEAIVRDLLVESPLVHPSVMLRSATLRALSGYREIGGPEDYDLWLRAHAAGARFAKLPQTLLGWRDSPTRLTRRDPRYARERFRALKLDALLSGPLRGRAAVVWGAGPIGKGFARALVARGARVAAFVEVDRRKLGQRIHGAPVVPLAQAARFPGAVHLAAVGQPGARERIRCEAERLGIPDSQMVAVA